MFKFLNKGISTPGAIFIVIIVVLVVGGITWWQYRMMPQTSVTPTSIGIMPSPTNETVDWKTYQNVKYGFEIKYPAGTTLFTQATPISLTFNEENGKGACGYSNGIFCASIENPFNLRIVVEEKPSAFSSLEAYVGKTNEECQKGFKGSATGGSCQIKEVMVGSQRTFALVSRDASVMGNTSVSVYFEKPDYLFEISYGYAQGELDAATNIDKSQGNKDWARQVKDAAIIYGITQNILSTFKFSK